VRTGAVNRPGEASPRLHVSAMLESRPARSLMGNTGLAASASAAMVVLAALAPGGGCN
jgi:hypothetical protein